MTLCKINKGANSYWLVSFFDEHKSRKTITLSAAKFSERTARDLDDAVKTLVYNRTNGIKVPDKRLKTWIESADRAIQEKLAKVDLIDLMPSITCKQLWDDFLKSHQREIKESSFQTYIGAQRHFFLTFDEGEYIENLTKPIMLRWKESLLDSLSVATVAGTITKTKKVFKWAVEFGLIAESPLKGVGRGEFANRANDQEITMADYARLLAACPCVEWRVILAFARIGGLRCPSEMRLLRWKDVEWDKNRFYVQSPKTEQYRGKEGRWVPLFSELRKELTELQRECGEAEYVINRYRNPSTTRLGGPFARIVRKAGLTRIKRPFDNMRMSRSNEIYRQYGAFKEKEWIGHSAQVRGDHYLMMGDADYSDAAEADRE
jgi:integrase